MRVAIVGATGQVGIVLRSILAERAFPVSDMRYLASSRSAGTTLPWGEREITVEDAGHGRSLRDRSGVVLGPGLGLARAGPAPGRGGSHRHRQLVGLAPGSRRPPGRPRGQRGCAGLHPQGDRGQSELHHDGGHPRAQAAARRGGPHAHHRLDLPGRVRGRGRGRPRAGRATVQDGRPRPGPHLRRRCGGLPTPRCTRARSPTTSFLCSSPSSTTARSRPTRSRSTATRAARSWASPSFGTCTCVRVPVFTGHSASIVAEFSRELSVEGATAVLAAARGGPGRDPDPAHGGRGRRVLCRPVATGPGAPHALAFFVVGDNLRKGRPSTWCRSPRRWWRPVGAERAPLSPVPTTRARARRPPGRTCAAPG